MFEFKSTFSSFSVDDLQKAKDFYSDTLGLSIQEEGEMGISLKLPDNYNLFIYPKKDHRAATFTVLNFVVENIDISIQILQSKGIEFLKYDNKDLPQDDKGILRGLTEGIGPDIAWFEDPAGNVLAILQEKI